MSTAGEVTADHVVVLHVGMVLAQRAPSIGGTALTLPATDGASDAELAAMVRRRVETRADPDESIYVNGKRYPVVVIPPMLLPRTGDDQEWVVPEDVTADRFCPELAELLEPLRQRMLDGVPLTGGQVSDVTRVGGTVRRETGPWTPAVHAALAHLDNFGLDAVPRVLGIDARGREILTYMPGRQVDTEHQFLSDIQIAESTSWLLRMHEALRTFNHPGPFRGVTPGDATIIGHQDFGAHNLCFAGNRLVGVIDWDFLGPTTVPLELAWFAWSVVPLGGFLRPAAAAHRVQLIGDTYDVDPTAIIDAVPERIGLLVQTIREGRSAKDPGAIRLSQAGEPETSLERLKVFMAEAPEIRAALSSQRGSW